MLFIDTVMIISLCYVYSYLALRIGKTGTLYVYHTYTQKTPARRQGKAQEEDAFLIEIWEPLGAKSCYTVGSDCHIYDVIPRVCCDTLTTHPLALHLNRAARYYMDVSVKEITLLMRMPT